MNEQNKGRLNEKEDGRKSSKKRMVTPPCGEEKSLVERKELRKERKVIGIHIQTWRSWVLVKSMKNYRGGCANERKDKIQFRFDSGKRGEGNRKDEV